MLTSEGSDIEHIFQYRLFVEIEPSCDLPKNGKVNNDERVFIIKSAKCLPEAIRSKCLLGVNEDSFSASKAAVCNLTGN